MPSFIPVSLLVPYQVSGGTTQLFMQTRVEDGPLNGLLEFAGGKIEHNETPEAAAMREFCEEVEVITGTCHQFKMYKHDYNDRSVCLFVNIMRVEDKDFCKGSWVDLPETFHEDDWVKRVPDANIEIIKDLTNYLFQN